jgi:hypothetical protein
MRTSPRAAAALLAVVSGLAIAPVAAAEPAPAPTPIDCGPYGGVSKALEAAAEHVSPPLGTDRPTPPGFRAPPPQRCQ